MRRRQRGGHRHVERRRRVEDTRAVDVQLQRENTAGSEPRRFEKNVAETKAGPKHVHLKWVRSRSSECQFEKSLECL